MENLKHLALYREVENYRKPLKDISATSLFTFYLSMAATFELVSVCIAVWWRKYGCPRHNLGKCKLFLRHRI